MTETTTTPPLPRPPYDPEVLPALEAAARYIPATLTREMIPALRTERGPSAGEKYAALGIEWRDVSVPGHDGHPLTASIYQRPGRTGTGPGIYYAHGGGMIFGDRHGGPEAFADLILGANAVVVSIDYRLAPEHPDPLPVEDVYSGLVWTAAHLAELGIEADRFLVAGHSAGAGLTAGTMLLARDRHGPSVRAQMLMTPMLDDRDATTSTLQYEATGTVSRGTNTTAWSAVLGQRRAGPEVSIYAAPARATDLSGLPETYLDCGSAEVFRDEGVAFASGIWAAGGQAELHVWAGGFHGFETMAPKAALSRTCLTARAAWLARTLHL